MTSDWVWRMHDSQLVITGHWIWQWQVECSYCGLQHPSANDKAGVSNHNLYALSIGGWDMLSMLYLRLLLVPLTLLSSKDCPWRHSHTGAHWRRGHSHPLYSLGSRIASDIWLGWILHESPFPHQQVGDSPYNASPRNYLILHCQYPLLANNKDISFYQIEYTCIMPGH